MQLGLDWEGCKNWDTNVFFDAIEQSLPPLLQSPKLTQEQTQQLTTKKK